MFYKLHQNVTNYLGYFCNKFLAKNFQKSPNLVALITTRDRPSRGYDECQEETKFDPILDFHTRLLFKSKRFEDSFVISCKILSKWKLDFAKVGW